MAEFNFFDSAQLPDPQTVQELDKALRDKALRNPIIYHVLARHHGQFTTEALYEVAIELERWCSTLANIAIRQQAEAPVIMPPNFITPPTDPPSQNHPTFPL